MPFCTNCGTQIQEGINFCGECGKPSLNSPCTCSNCGFKLLENSAFCSKCGNLVAAANTSIAVANSSEAESSFDVEKSLKIGTKAFGLLKYFVDADVEVEEEIEDEEEDEDE